MIFIVSVFTPWARTILRLLPVARMAQPSSVPKNQYITATTAARYQHADEQCHGDVSQADDHRLAQKRHTGFAHDAQIDGVKPPAV